MAGRLLFRSVAVLALLAFALAPPVWAGNYDYNFNSKPYDWTPFNTGSFTIPPSGTAAPWEWTGGASANEGGWHTRSGPDGAGPGTFLVSPCFIADGVGQDYVQLDMDHRFNFGGTGTAPLLALGQAQYRINEGAWVGVPLQAFLDANTGTSGNVLPTYASPLPDPPFDTSQLAWSGTTIDFTDSKKHEKSAFRFYVSGSNATLGVGDEIEFRFLMGPQLASAPPYDINWEINSVNIKGVTACPEPGALALAGIGGLGWLLVARRRRRWCPLPEVRTVCGSTAATVVVVVAIVCLLAAVPARAQTTSWNFQSTDGNWTTAGERLKQPPNAPAFWNWNTASITASPAKPRWHVTSEGVSRATASSYSITSPLLTTTGTVKSARISIAHNFLFQTGTDVKPLYSGQFEYQLNDSGTWVGLPLSAFTSGSVNAFNPVFGFSPFWSGTSLQLVDQSTFLVPNYLTPTGSNALPFLDPGAAAFTGTSPGWTTAYVPTQAFLSGTALVPAIGIQSLQLRFANLNYGAGCLPEDGWNVKFVQVDFSDVIDPVPEPATLSLTGLGLAALGAIAAGRRRAYQRASRPSDSP